MFVVTVLKIENKNLHHAQSHKRLRNSSAAHLLLSFKELNLLSENQPSSKVQFTRPKQSRRSPPSLIVKSKNKRTAMIVLLFSTLILFSSHSFKSNHHYKRPHVLLNYQITRYSFSVKTTAGDTIISPYKLKNKIVLKVR